MYPIFQKKKGSTFRVDPATVIAQAIFNFPFRNRTLTDSVSGTSPITVSRPSQKFCVDQNGRYAIVAAGSAAYDHSAAGSCYGVLTEGRSSNYIRNSNVFTGAGGWNVAPSGSPSGVAGGGQVFNLTLLAGVPGPVLGLENAAGYQATRFSTTGSGEHYVGKYGGYIVNKIEQIHIAFRLNGNTVDHALRLASNGVFITLGAQGQVFDSYFSDATTGAAGQNNFLLPKVRTTSDGWVLVSWLFDPRGGSGNNYNMPRIQVVKGADWRTSSFASTDDFSFDLFGFCREYAGSQADQGLGRLYSSYIHTASATGPVTRSADSMVWSAISASLKSVFVESYGPLYDCSLLSIDDNSGTAHVPKVVNASAYEPDNMIDLRAVGNTDSTGSAVRSSVFKVACRRGMAVTVNHNSDVFSTQSAHNLTAGMAVSFRPQSGTSLPTPLVGKLSTSPVTEQLYYVLPTGLTANDFMISTLPGGAPVDVTIPAPGNMTVRVSSTFTCGSPALDGAQRFVVSWDATNLTLGTPGGGSTVVAHGLGVAPTLTHMRFGTGVRADCLADLSQPLASVLGWSRVLTTQEQAALLSMP